MDVHDPLRLALLALAAGEQPPEPLPDLAADALTRDIDSSSLRELAGAPKADYDDNRALFRAAMVELGVEVPDPNAALSELVRFWASEIVAGSINPYAGASRIWRTAWRRLGSPSDLAIFVGLASEWEDHLGERADIEAQIVREARNLISA
jgi:hypothetical protein